MKRILLGFFLLVLTFTSAYADIAVSPLKHELTIEKGMSKTAIIKVKNEDTRALTIYNSKKDFIAGDESGYPEFVSPEDLPNPELSLSNWIDIENETITLAPGESREVKFTVTVPETADPGGHYGVVFFNGEIGERSQISTVTQLGVLILIDVPGEVRIGGDFTELDTGVMEVGEFKAQSEFSEFPITFSTVFENTGNIHLKPKGQIELVDENGEILKKVGKEKIVSQAGAIIGDKVVDYIPVNEVGGNALPNSKRRFNSTWEGFGYNVVNEVTGKKEVAFKSLEQYYKEKAAEDQKFIKFYQTVKERVVNKEITSNYYLYYEGKANEKKELRTSKKFNVTYTEVYIGYNIILLSISAFIILLIIVYIVVVLPKMRLKREKALRESIMKEMKK